ILVSMATGTGKTRTSIALMYRLLKHKLFRRILFLVDRKALGKQTNDALETTEIEGMRNFAQIYKVAGLEKKVPGVGRLAESGSLRMRAISDWTV
ncbi:DEAD/DEAH box helicase family protein, partial [Rhizobium leguminosarum]|uniref:DEAD/DEAH box helicase family protein n=1 Tax=Rhizobium leguminosarum TaxID=384 RepID=UPI003F9A2FC8